jgi:hypothetical protein
VQGRRNPIEGVLRGIEERLAAPWREEQQAREVEAEAHRDRLWAEAAERERLLVETVGAEESRRRSAGEICRDREGCVRHPLPGDQGGPGGAQRRRGSFRSGDRGRERLHGGRGLEGSWLIFE